LRAAVDVELQGRDPGPAGRVPRARRQVHHPDPRADDRLMRFEPTPIPGVFVIDVEPIRDERGFFARTWCRERFAEHGITTPLAQCNISYNARSGTLRGMHYQVQPHGEAKLVRVTRGAVFDVALDLRADSPTYKRW